MNNKIMFLDHDGVICLSNNWGGRNKKRKNWHKKNPPTADKDMPVEYRFDNFDRKAIIVLNKIIEQTDAEIVVSSDWKLHCTLEEMKDLYNKSGIIKTPINFTPNLKDFDAYTASLFSWKSWLEKARILEIREYLKKHPEIINWVAVDDLRMDIEGLENFVLCSRMSEGIKQLGIKEKIISFLN